MGLWSLAKACCMFVVDLQISTFIFVLNTLASKVQYWYNFLYFFVLWRCTMMYIVAYRSIMYRCITLLSVRHHYVTYRCVTYSNVMPHYITCRYVTLCYLPFRPALEYWEIIEGKATFLHLRVTQKTNSKGESEQCQNNRGETFLQDEIYYTHLMTFYEDDTFPFFLRFLNPI
jgi:hypothetical protein